MAHSKFVWFGVLHRDSLQLLFTALFVLCRLNWFLIDTCDPFIHPIPENRSAICIDSDMISIGFIPSSCRRSLTAQIDEAACWSNQSHSIIIISFNVRFYEHCNLSFALRHIIIIWKKLERLAAMKPMPAF